MRRILLLCVLPACATAYLTYAGYGVWRQSRRVAPTLEYAATLNLGSAELGQQACQRVLFKNRGGRDLVVDDVRTNCSCSGLETKVDGKFARFKALVIAPGQEVDLWLRISVRGVSAGESLANRIEFRTNDPALPTGRIDVVIGPVSGGVQARPEKVAMGTVAVGTVVRRRVEIWDDAVEPRRIQAVRSFRPDLVLVTLLRVDESESERDLSQGARRIGVVEVVVNTAKPGDVDQFVEIEVPGRPPDTIHVVGRIAAPVEFAPSAIVLPRNSPSGPVHETLCLCRSTVEKPLVLHVDDPVEGLAVEILPANEETMKMIRIRCEQLGRNHRLANSRQVLHFRAKVDGSTIEADLPVYLGE